MNIFGKKEMKVLASLKNVEAKDITAEQIAAVNAELAEAGLIGIEANLFGSSNVASENIAAHEQAVSDLKAELQSSKDLAATHEATIAELTEKLAKTPAAAVEEVETGEDKITGTKDETFTDDNSPSAKHIKEFFGK